MEVTRFYVPSRDVDYKGFVEFLEGRLAKAYANAKGIEHDAAKASSDPATARLTDVKNYTGAAKERFDPATGKGKGKLGREDAPPAFTTSGISAPRHPHGDHVLRASKKPL
ncbi:unnamed protein product [Dibothriocephalus latus]|uniref:Tubulin polymerization-promoting protein family member 3 n=1 Tax=Dibothriocephalus latus TaxID=60516 RepID=A0A3P6TUW9_DIBLA|nr:unnamed protein product [Dibothriocephalus latus]